MKDNISGHKKFLSVQAIQLVSFITLGITNKIAGTARGELDDGRVEANAKQPKFLKA